MSMIGNQPGVSSQRTVLEEVVTGSPKSAFVPQYGYVKGYVDVLVNGHELDSVDFTADDGITVNLAVAAAVGDTVKVKAWIPRGLSDGYTKAEADAKYLALIGGTLSGNLVLGSAASGSEAQLALGGYNAGGGAGYHQFLSLKNAYGSATNPNKYFRLSSGGDLQIINSAYSATIFGLSDAGNLSIAGYLSGGSVPLARLASSGTTALAGTADATTYLRGDGSWQTPVAGLTQVSYSQSGAGWLRLSNGFMIQWGITQYIADYGRAFQSFPTSFPNACFVVCTQNVDSEDSSWMDNLRVYDLVTTGFTMFRRGNNSRNWFIAIGY